MPIGSSHPNLSRPFVAALGVQFVLRPPTPASFGYRVQSILLLRPPIPGPLKLDRSHRCFTHCDDFILLRICYFDSVALLSINEILIKNRYPLGHFMREQLNFNVCLLELQDAFTADSPIWIKYTYDHSFDVVVD